MPALKRKSTEGSMAKKPSLRRDTTLSLKTTDEAPPISPDPSFRNVSSSQLSPKISLKRKATLVSEGTGVYSSVTTLESGSSVGKTGSLRATSVGKDYDLIPLSTSHSKKASLGTSSDAVAALLKSVSELKELTESTPPMTRSLSKRASLSKRKSGIPSDTLSSTSPPLPPGGLIEIVISFDTTGSMYSCLEEVRGRIQDMVQRLQADIPGIRIAVIAHGDYCDASNYIIKWIDFGATVPELCDFVKTVSLTTGGDADECYELVLRRAREVLSWTPGSQRSLVIIGDSGPHEVGYKYRDFVNDIDWRVEATELKKMGVRIYSVVVNAIPIPFYQHISHLTGGQVISLPRFGFIFDLLMSICYKESGPELFEAYEAEAKEKNKDEELDTILDGIFSTLGDRFGTGPSSGFPFEGPPSSKPVTDPDFSLQLKPLRPMGGDIFSPGISSTPEGEKAGKATKTTKAYKAEDGKSGFGMGPSSGFPIFAPPIFTPMSTPGFPVRPPYISMGGGICPPGTSSSKVPKRRKLGKATKTTKAYKAEDGKSGFGMGPSSGFAISAPPFPTPMSTPGFPVRPPYMPVGGGICPPGTSSSKVPKRRKLGKATKTSKAYKAEDGKSGLRMGPSSGFAISAPPFPTPMSTPGFPVPPPFMPVGGGICPPGTSSSKVPKRRKLGKATKTSKAYKAEDGKSGFGMGPSSGFAISAPPFPTPMSTPGFPVPPAFMPVGGGICPPGTSSSKVPKRGKLGKATKTSKAYKAEDGKSGFGMGPSSGFAISAPPFPTPMSTPGFPVPPAFMPVGGGICPPGTSSSKVPKRGKLGKATKTSKAYKAEDGKSEFGMGPSSGFPISAPPFPTPMSTPGFPVPPAFMPVGGGICPPRTSSSKVPKRGKLGKAIKTSKKITQSRGLVNRESLTDTKFTTGPLKRLMWSKWMVGITKTSTASPGSKLVRRDWCGGYCNAGILESKDVVGVPAVYEIGIRLYGKRKIYPVFYKVTTGVPKGNSWFNYLLSKRCSAVKEVLNSHADVIVRKGQFKRKGVAFIHNVTQLLSKKYDYAWEGRRDRKMKSRNLKRCGVKISSDSY